MINFLHSFQPSPELISYGSLSVYWYGLLVVGGITVALLISLRLAKYYSISPDRIFDLSFYLIIGGLIGARLYDIFLQLPYYSKYPWQIFAIWKGGLAIHGAILSGLAIIYFFARRHKIDFWKLGALLAPGLAIGQAIGRWGNYFNQELFGLPTQLPWGIPIDLINRPWQYIEASFFHPTFLYESLACLAIGLALLAGNIYAFKKKRLNRHFYVCSVSFYMILYSISRFSLEFIRIDEAPSILGLRWPQIASLTIILAFILILLKNNHADLKKRDD